MTAEELSHTRLTALMIKVFNANQAQQFTVKEVAAHIVESQNYDVRQMKNLQRRLYRCVKRLTETGVIEKHTQQTVYNTQTHKYQLVQ